MSAIARKVLAMVSVIISVFAVGYLSGLYLAPELTANVSQSADQQPHAEKNQADHSHDDDDDHPHPHPHPHGDDTHDDHAHEDEEGEHLALTEQAFQNLGLKLGKISLEDYWKSQSIPGEVVEIPGRSTMTVSAPVTGVIDDVFVRPGQTVASTDQLFTLRLTDDYLMAAQSKLLSEVARAEIVRKEITRLAPLTATGAVAGRRKRDLEFELAQLESSQAVLRQEIRSRGLPNFMIGGIAEGRLLASTLDVTAPAAASSGVLAYNDPLHPIALERTAPRSAYAVEEVKVHPGQAVERGEDLCTLSNHAELYIRGQAFETDLPLLDQLVEKDWDITAEFGHDHEGDDTQTITRRNLKLLRIDNAVESESQTLTFFLPLTNEIAQTIEDDDHRSFVHWRYKPGQRVHLKVPIEKWQNQMVLPLEAVMIDGPNATVFVEHAAHGDAEKVFVELEPVPVRLLHRDDQFAVIAADGQLTTAHRVALNSAYKLQQALQMQVSGGGGQAHGHEH